MMEFWKYTLTWASDNVFLSLVFLVLSPVLFGVFVILPLAIFHDTVIGISNAIASVFKR